MSFIWQEHTEENQPLFGDGISRPKPTDITKPFKVIVRVPGALPMTWTTPAPNPDAAISYAKARWPHARISLPSKDRTAEG